MNLHRSAAAFGAATLALWMGLPLLAQSDTTPLGTVTASLGGTAYEGETLDVASEGTATAEARFFGPVTSVSIQAHDPRSDKILHNVLSLEFSLMGENATDSLMDATVSWWPEGMGQPFYISEGNEADLNLALDALSLEDGAARASGRFTALICRKDGFFSEIDPDDCLPVEGSFETALRKAD